jgi:hypothetical protein
MIKITLYQYTGQRNVINKTLPMGVERLGVLRGATDVITPTITIRVKEPIKENYAYLPDFKRYYFIDNITYISGDKAEINLSVDVLKSYEKEIMNATATVTKTDTPDKYASNRETVYNRKPKFEKVEFPNKNLLNDTGTIVMVTIKGSLSDINKQNEQDNK